MIRIPRKSLAVSLAAVLTVGVSATAFGDGVTDNTSQVSAGINPTLLPSTGTPKAAGLYAQVVTLDNDNTPVIPDQAAEKVRLDFPAEMKYTTNSKLAQCPLADVATDTTDGAASDPVCSDALIGSGHAFARIPGFPTPNNEAELTVLAFNGRPPPLVAVSRAGSRRSSCTLTTRRSRRLRSSARSARRAQVPTTAVS